MGSESNKASWHPAIPYVNGAYSALISAHLAYRDGELQPRHFYEVEGFLRGAEAILWPCAGRESKATAPTSTADYIRHVMAVRGISASALAKASGLAPSTLNRILNDAEHPFEISVTTLKRIAAFSRISPVPFLAAIFTIEEPSDGQ